jgi:3'-phosphoadenosine 5'-phosphosulfate sulfotransferase (PAPS reductase)/FAD synthetase
MKINNNKNIFCSVSSGYSSVMMAIMMPTWFPDHNIINVMANTSKEDPESLHFMNECDKYYNLNLVWIEAEFHEHGVGVTPNIVTYENLKRNGEIFEQGIKKLGIPSKVNKWCNRDMKLEVLRKYADSIFGKDYYSIAVGLRTDEMDRIRKDFRNNNVFYPLINYNISKKERNKFWKDKPIQINLPAYKGNCDMCFQKSNRKLMTILKEEPYKGDWWDDMIKKYGTIKLEGKDSYNDLMEVKGTQTFYRGYNTIEDLVKMAKQPFSKATDEYIYENDLFDKEDECGSGCQVF